MCGGRVTKLRGELRELLPSCDSAVALQIWGAARRHPGSSPGLLVVFQDSSVR